MPVNGHFSIKEIVVIQNTFEKLVHSQWKGELGMVKIYAHPTTWIFYITNRNGADSDSLIDFASYDSKNASDKFDWREIRYISGARFPMNEVVEEKVEKWGRIINYRSPALLAVSKWMAVLLENKLPMYKCKHYFFNIIHCFKTASR